jgi:Flp pilus assembly protein TadD
VALLRQGDARGAADKFAETSRLAPNWGFNRMMWGQALARLGDRSGARAQYAAARAAGLRPADAQTLQVLEKAL